MFDNGGSITSAQMLDSLPRVSLTTLPTPLEEAPRLAKEIGLDRLLIKRDDLTGLALGGNKVRKLEFLMADALARGADTVITVGGPQSNHARLTAAAARKVGIKRCVLVVGGPEPECFEGNLVLDDILGAEIVWSETGTVRDLEYKMRSVAEKMADEGSVVYAIPLGGSTPIGALGYVNAMRELATQLPEDDRRPQIVVAVGSAGTIAGCALGIRLFAPGAILVGVSVTRKSRSLQESAACVANGAARLLKCDSEFALSDFRIYEEYYGLCYGVPTPEGDDAIRLAATTEALILDPVYTGKAMAGLIDLTHRGELDRERTVIFIHTGGAPALFARLR
jgi:D-cysteine desulfhydrase family pyridoxal phosphate-dependent enzyme